MNRTTYALVIGIALSSFATERATAGGSQQPANALQQITSAVSAAPEDRREGATVMGYGPDGDLMVLRQGDNEIICLADNPADDRFQVSCYHQSLEPFMVRGRELRAQGIGSTENLSARHTEADEGKIPLPEHPAALYNLGGDLEIYNAETGAVEGGYWVWSIYTPYATERQTGLPTTPQAPGAPWIMRPGTPSSHIMVVQPREPKPTDSP